MKSVKAKGVELAAHLQQSELLYSSFASTILPHILLACDIVGVEVAVRAEDQVVDGVADLSWETEQTWVLGVGTSTVVSQYVVFMCWNLFVTGGERTWRASPGLR